MVSYFGANWVSLFWGFLQQTLGVKRDGGNGRMNDIEEIFCAQE